MILYNSIMAIIANNSLLITSVRQFPDDDFLNVLTNGGSIFFVKSVLLRLLRLHVHVKRYSVLKIIELKDAYGIPGVCVIMVTVR